MFLTFHRRIHENRFSSIIWNAFKLKEQIMALLWSLREFCRGCLFFATASRSFHGFEYAVYTNRMLSVMAFKRRSEDGWVIRSRAKSSSKSVGAFNFDDTFTIATCRGWTYPSLVPNASAANSILWRRMLVAKVVILINCRIIQK